ncbi:MAG: hypothetical protein Q7Q73_14555 [Verrucomicrobiota bacterium JB024]|nr:hypothetical protein [Verrucomicrobiota bacterium JB024]
MNLLNILQAGVKNLPTRSTEAISMAFVCKIYAKAVVNGIKRVSRGVFGGQQVGFLLYFQKIKILFLNPSRN